MNRLALARPLPRLSAAVAGLAWLLSSCESRHDPGVAAQRAAQSQAYKNQIEVSKIGLAKGENYLGGEVYYVEGTLRNAGTRVVQRVELTFLFRDSLNQVILKQSRKAVEYKGDRGLEGDKSTRFQVAFDHLPKDWNYVIPEVEVSQVVLKD